MPDSLTTFTADHTRVRLDADGTVTGVAHTDTPAEDLLHLGLPGEAGRPALRSGAPTVDADELELELVGSAGLRVTVRQTFVAGWQLRCLLANTGPDRRTVRLHWPLSITDAAVGWALAEGAEAELFVQPRHGRGPVLAGRLRQGSVAGIDETGLQLPELILEPGGRYVLAWEWDWLSSPATYARRRPGIHPGARTVLREQPIRLPAGPDTALVVPPELGMETVDDGYLLSASAPVSAVVELRSARGLRSVPLGWTPTPDELLRRLALRQLDGPRGRTGVVRLPGLAEAAIVQYARAADLVDDPDQAEDALGQYAAALLPDPAGEAGRPEPRPTGEHAVMQALFLCGEYERTGDPEFLTAASDRLIGAGTAAGVGVVGTRLWVAHLAAGSSPYPVLEHLVRLRAGLDPDRHDPATATELRAVTIGTADVRSGQVGDASGGELLDLVLALGTQLGSGLPGGPVRSLPVGRLGHLLTVFSLLPDTLAEPTRRLWDLSAADLAARTRPTLIARLTDAQIGVGHIWLTLISGTG
jgi:hypothetical protein